MAENIYPENSRVNCFAGMYCEIAMEAYFRAHKDYQTIKDANFSGEYICECCRMEKEIVKVVVFSAMSIESFLNDYAAACLGDTEFYDNFDKLSCISKFQLIAKFILKSDVKKEEKYYCYLKNLFRARDSYVHNKSVSFNIRDFLSRDELIQFEQNSYDWENHEMPDLNKEEINQSMLQALDALKAVKELAVYFDTYDARKIATGRLFHPIGVLVGKDDEKEYKKMVFSKLNIKAEELL